MTVEMVIKRLYFASAKKRRNCTFRFEKMYVSFSRLYYCMENVCKKYFCIQHLLFEEIFIYFETK